MVNSFSGELCLKERSLSVFKRKALGKESYLKGLKSSQAAALRREDASLKDFPRRLPDEKLSDKEVRS